jgi:hypothetical protein
MRPNLVIESAATKQGAAAAESLIRRAFRRFRLPLREASGIEESAARGRAERLFAVNFRSTWNR